MALRVEGKDKLKTILSMEEGDELLKRGRDVAEAYDQARRDEKDGEQRKEAAKLELQTIITLLAGYENMDFEKVDSLELGVVMATVKNEDTGQAYTAPRKRVFRKSISQRKTIVGAKLLELGVSAAVIEAATTTNDVTSWTVADSNP